MDSKQPYDSEYLRREATTQDGVFVEEIWEAIVAREAIIDQLAEGGSMNVDDIRDSGYFDASRTVRGLQESFDIEPYPILDE